MGPADPDDRRFARGMALAQVGFEMAAPIGLGAWLDYLFAWSPWGAVVGAVVGLVGGIFHLVWMADRENRGDDDS